MSNSTEVVAIQSSDLAFIHGLDTFEDLENAAKNNATILNIEKSHFAGINMKETFKRLVICADLLIPALRAARDQPCSTSIGNIIAKYQTMVNEFGTLFFDFVNACTKGLKIHKTIKSAFERDEPDLAFQTFADLWPLALHAKTTADGMTAKVKNLLTLSEEALQPDESTSAEQKKQIEKLIDQTQASRVALQESVKELGRLINEVREDEEKHARAAESARDRQFGLQMAGAIIGAKTRMAGKENIANLEEEKSKASEALMTKAADSQSQHAATADEKRAAATAHRRKLATLLTEDKTWIWKLAKDIEALKTMSQDTELEQVIRSLIFCIRALIQVETTLDQVAMFWDALAFQCGKFKALSTLSSGDIKGWSELNKGFTDEIKQVWEKSVAGWAALGSVNIKAWRAMQAAGADINAKVGNLGVVHFSVEAAEITEFEVEKTRRFHPRA